MMSFYRLSVLGAITLLFCLSGGNAEACLRFPPHPETDTHVFTPEEAHNSCIDLEEFSGLEVWRAPIGWSTHWDRIIPH